MPILEILNFFHNILDMWTSSFRHVMWKWSGDNSSFPQSILFGSPRGRETGHLDVENQNRQRFGIWFLFQAFFSDGSNNILSNIEQTRTSFFEHRTNLNVFIYWWSNSNTWILASNERTLNVHPKSPSLDLLNYSSNRLEHHFFEHRT